MKEKPVQVYIVGAGKFAEEVADTLSMLTNFYLKGFIEGIDKGKTNKLIHGLPVFWIDNIDKLTNP